MNRSKRLYILLGILAAACIGTFVVTQMEERREQIRETGEIILELPSESVQALSWEYDGETLAFHKDEAWLYDEDENFPVSEEKSMSCWSSSNPSARPLSLRTWRTSASMGWTPQSAPSSCLRRITNLNPVNYVSYHATDEELRAYGLDAPELTVTVDYTSEGEDGEEVEDAFILYISPDPEDVKAAEEAQDGEKTELSAYIRVGESQIIYNVSSSSYKKLAAASRSDLRHSEVIWADFSDVQRIDISLEGNSYTLTSEKDKDKSIWFYRDKDDLDIGDFQSSLENLTADEFTHERPTQREEIGLTVYLDNESFPQVEIKLYRYDGSRCLAVIDGESVSLVERAAVVDLMEAVHAIVLD